MMVDDLLQTILSVNPWAIHHNVDLFGQDADDFNPDRWLVAGSKKMEKNLIAVRMNPFL